MRTILIAALLALAALSAMPTSAQTPDPATIPNYQFVNCVTDNSGHLLATGYPTTSSKNYFVIPSDIGTLTTAAYCAHMCHSIGNLYSAVDANNCTCGVHFRGENTVSSNYCENNCAGADACGGANYAAVFRIEVPTCPTDSNYYLHHDFCYRFESYYTTNWTVAEHVCHSEGGHLVTIESERENNFVLSLPNVISTSSNIGSDFWAGGFYLGVSNGFEWITGYLPTFYDWKEGEPKTGIYNENCLDLSSATSTPIGGTWSSQSCGAVKKYMCKKFVNSTGVPPALTPRVQIVAVGSTEACVPPTNVILDHVHLLEAHFTLDPQTVDNFTNIATDSSPHHRNAALNSYNNFATGLEFNRNDLTWGSSLRFDGNLTVVLPTGWDVMSEDTLTVTAWVRTRRHHDQSPRRFEVIVSKDRTDVPHFGDSFAWSLMFIDNEFFCFNVGEKSACSPSGGNHHDHWRFVVGVYDGKTVNLYIDGAQVSSIAGITMPLIHNRSTPVVIGGQAFAVNWSTRVTFEGHLDDVRIYSAALPIGDIQYLQECELRPFLHNVIEAYVATPITLVLMGHDLTGHQRFGLSTTGCENGTAFDSNYPPIFSFGYTTVRHTLVFPAAQIVSGDYSICYTTPNQPTTYEGGLNLTLRVVQMIALNGTHRHVSINTDTIVNQTAFISAMVPVSGVNLHDRTVFLLSPFQTCSYSFGNAIGFLNSSSADGTTASLEVFHASIANDFYYVCWAGSFEDALNANRVVPTGLVIELVGSRYTTKIVAFNDGTTSVNAQNIIDGFALNHNYFLDCNSLNDTNDRYFLTVTMGAFTDYLIPAPGYTACDVLLGKYVSAPWGGTVLYLASSHSHISPTSPFYDASATRLIPAGTHGSLGGSASGFPTDGREQLTQWGTNTSHNGVVGGCCYSAAHQDRAWYQPYTIMAHSYNHTAAYFQVNERPSIVFPNEIFSIRLRMVNIHGEFRNISGGCDFEVHQDNRLLYTVAAGFCDQIFRVNITHDFSSFRVHARISDPNSIHYIANMHEQEFIVTTSPLPLGGHLLNSGSNVTRVLSYRNEDGLHYVMNVSNHDASTDMFQPSDALIEPVEEQQMIAYDYLSSPVATYDWTWVRIEDDSGLFGQVVPFFNGVQYFAFSFYSTVTQKLFMHGGCIGYIYGWDFGRRAGRDFMMSHRQCVMYIDGVKVERQDEHRVTSGWHQVIVKIVNGRPTGPEEGFFLSFDGSGIAVNVEKPLGAPDGSTLLVTGRPIEQFMWLRTNPTVADSFEVNGLPGGIPEAFAFPTEDGDWFPINTPTMGLLETPPLTAYQMALFYFGTGIYATSFGSATFTIPNAAGAIRVIHDGELIANFAADVTGPTRTITLRFFPGWSQLLFKVSASNMHRWAFRMVLEQSENVVLFAEPAIPEELPTGVIDFKTRPLGAALALLSQGSAVYALSYDTASTTDAAAVDPTYTQVNTSRFNHAGDAETVNEVPFVWTPVSALDTKTGYIGEGRNDGGGYNRYYSFAMFVSRHSDTLNATLHYHEGVGVWFDGTFIRGNASTSGDAGMMIHLRNVTRGWHTVHIRLQSLNSLKFVSLASVSHELAFQTCWNNGLNLCDRAFDVCPLDVARNDIGIPVQGSSWAALGKDEEWIQLSNDESNQPLCSRVMGDSAMAGNTGTYQAACCGVEKPPYFSFSVDGIPSRTRIGWAAAVPPQAPWAPFVFHVPSASDAQILMVTIFSNQSGVEILYTTNPATYPTTTYTGPFEVRYAGVVRAITRLNGVDSFISEVFITVQGNLTMSRGVCTKGPDCFVQLGRSHEVTSALGNWLVSVVDTSGGNNQVLQSVIASSYYVRNADPDTSSFTGFISVDSNNVVRIPASMLARPSVTQVTIVLFESDATYRDTHGIAVQYAINVTAVTPTIQHLHRNLPFAPVTLTGGFIGGDRIAFPELFIDPVEWQANHPNEAICSVAACQLVGTRAFFAFHMAHFTNTDTFLVNSSYVHPNVTSLTCGCVQSFGELNVPRADYEAKYSIAGVVKFTSAVAIVDLPAPDATKSFEIISFGPRVVSARHDESDGTFAPRPFAPDRDNRVWVYGNFPSTTATDYTATLECAAGVITTTEPFNCSGIAPAVRVADVSAGAMTLHVHAYYHGVGISGLWTLRIQQGSTLPNTPHSFESRFFVGVLHPTPNITAADGDCVRASSSCQHSHVITFVGYDFNAIDIHRNKIDFLDSYTKALSRTTFCLVEQATEFSIICRLFLLSPAAAGASVDVIARVEAIPAHHQSGEVFASSVFDTHHTLRFEAQGAGWNGAIAPIATTQTPNNNDSPSDSGSSGPNVGVIIAVVCGVLLVGGIVGAVIVVTKFDLMPKKRNANQMNEVEESLHETYSPEQEAV